MKTLLISSAPPPAALRDVVARGSTAIDERRPDDVAVGRLSDLGVDRVVIWVSGSDRATRALAARFARAGAPEARAGLIVVTDAAEPGAIDGLAAEEVFCWPRDEDRLTMAFMTSA